MSPPIGPKGPADTTTGRVLPFRRPEVAPAAPTTAAAPVAPSEPASAAASASSQQAATFEAVAGSALSLAAPVEGAALSQLVARLWAAASTERVAPVGPAIVKTDEGLVLSGSLTIDTREGFRQVKDAVRIDGSLAIEGTIKNVDLHNLSQLKSIAGSFVVDSLKAQ